MDFIDWTLNVLYALTELNSTTENANWTGINVHSLSYKLFDNNLAALQSKERREALLSAIEALLDIGCLTQDPAGSPWLHVTRFAEDYLEDSIPLWEAICANKLRGPEMEMLATINRLSERQDAEYAWLEYVDRPTLLTQTGLEEIKSVFAQTKGLEGMGLVAHEPYLSTNSGWKTTYRGLIWETRRRFTTEAKRIDLLVEEWETTSVDFKREYKARTNDEKAELVKDAIGLANTQASGRRLILIGFDDKTRKHVCGPDSKLTQDWLENILSVYSAPMIDARYSVIPYRSGEIGQIEIIRNPRKLPYSVAKDVGGLTKRVRLGQVFVRHGSHTEEPTNEELRLIQEEGDRARGFVN